jgi:predicted kinase
MLIVFSGLPGVGKTTVARELALRCSAAYLRIDAIEQAIRNANVLAADIGTAGYSVALALAESNLAIGRIVVADCVNPVVESRAAWQAMTGRMQLPIYNIEVICSDVSEHRHRVEARRSDIPGHVMPSWDAVQRRSYEPWAAERLVVDTARLTQDEAVARIKQYIGLLPDHHI